MSNTGEAHFANPALTNSPYTTNRILEIPQDIKLELNNGTLTLKAGSKVYVPNGFEADGTTPKFDVVIIDNDKTASTSSFSGFVFYRSDNNILHLEALQPISGTTPPSEDGTWYDTNANKIKRYENSSFVYDGISFPLCKFSSGSIDQVFNGFGYIGNTRFALPNVQVQIPEKRNADGKPKCRIYKNDRVRTQTIILDDVVFIIYLDENTFDVSSTTYFNADMNYTVDTDGYHNGTKIVGRFLLSSGKVTSWDIETVDSVVNSNASNFSQAGRSYLSGLGMPGSRYIVLTLGASGSRYIAPANGYFLILCSGLSYIDMYKPTADGFGINDKIEDSGYFTRRFVPVLKGETIIIYYTGTPVNLSFRFIYTEGENNV